jgi:hypothetical protein
MGNEMPKIGDLPSNNRLEAYLFDFKKARFFQGGITAGRGGYRTRPYDGKQNFQVVG